MLPIFIQELSQSKHYPYTAFLGREAIHNNLYPSSKLPESPFNDVSSPYLIPMSAREGIKSKTIPQVSLQALDSLRNNQASPALPFRKPIQGFPPTWGREDPLGLRKY